MVKAVIFDVGGVLHTHDTTAMHKEICAYFGLTGEEFQKEWRTLRPLRHSNFTEAELWQRFRDDLKLTKPMPDESLLSRGLRLTFKKNHQILPFIEELKAKGIRVAILSNTIPAHADFLRTQGVYDGFDPVVLSFETGLRKPDPAIYELALNKLGVSADEAVFVDDLKPNVDAAEAVGMRGILFENVDQLRRDL